MQKKLLSEFLGISLMTVLLMGIFGLLITLDIYNATLEQHSKNVLDYVLWDRSTMSYAEIDDKLKEYRLTIIAFDGTVLYDTEGAADNHLSRPEVAEALRGTVGNAVRRSDTTGKFYKYTAEKSDDCIIRVAVYMSDLGKIFTRTAFYVLFAMLLTGAIAVILAVRMSKKITRPLNELVEYANSMTLTLTGTIRKADMFPELLNLSNSIEYMTGELVSRLAEIEKLERVRSEFVSNVSHELKTPLTSIKGFVETLKLGAINNPEKAERFLDIIEIEATRLQNLINDTLALSDIERMEEDSNVIVFLFDSLVLEVFDLMRKFAAEHEVTLRFDPQRPVSVRANRDRMKQLLLNLVSNGIKYNKRGGYVRVAVEAGVVLTVEDNGQGIPEEEKERLFERFYRIDKGRSRESGGTGLGLSIVKHIAELYQGTVEIESVLTKGSRFIVRLPIGVDEDDKSII